MSAAPSTSKTTTAFKLEESVINDKITILQQSEIKEFETRSNYNVVLQQLTLKTLQTRSRLEQMTK
ncbi:hypothetical protein EBU95_15575 [bacterium]|nr:hypothetical protein [bacterium]